MRWTVVVPGALVPDPIAADVLASAAAPWLARALTRAEFEPAQSFDSSGATHLAWLWQQFGGAAGTPVTAPYALRALDDSIDIGAQCWHFDPVHFAFARDHMLVSPPGDTPPSEDVVAMLAQHARAALGEVAASAQPQLHLLRKHWLLTLAAPWSLITTPLDAALGQSAHEHWPDGEDARLWRKLLTEIQMRWHQESLDEAREAGGERAINALWLHGGGAWRSLPKTPFTAAVSDDPTLRGWALASGVAAGALHAPGACPPAGAAVVSLWRGLLLASQFEAWGQWLAHLTALEEALQSLHQTIFAAGYKELALVLCGRREVRIVRLRNRDALRFWRRQRWAQAFTEQRDNLIT